MSFYDDFENLFLAKRNETTNSSIENIWNIIKECCDELNVAKRTDLGTYSFMFGFSKYLKNKFWITFLFHIVESEHPEEYDENYSFYAEFLLKDEPLIENIEEDEIEGSAILGSYETNIKKMESWEIYKLLKNNSYEVTFSQTERFL